MSENEIRRQGRRRHVKSNRGNVEVNIYFGLLLMAVGVLWLLHNYGMLPLRVVDMLFSWQMLMVAVGGYLVVSRKYTAGVIVGGLGVMFLAADMLDIYISMGKVALPAILIAIGLAIIIPKLGRR